MKLAQIPGFADVADVNFAAEHFATGLNIQRIVDNAKVGIVRPEVFVGRYINGDTVPLPVSTVDGYTYTRDELCYLWNVVTSGSTAANSGSTPSASGSIRFMGQLVDGTGKVYSYVNYQTGDGGTNTTTNDGVLEVFTFAVRRADSLVVTERTDYAAVANSELDIDDAVTESVMQRLNRNAKHAALSCEVLNLGEFTNGQTVPMPVSPVDGYAYSQAETTFAFSWRWTTQADEFVTPPYPPYKQLQDLQASISPAGLVSINVVYYDNGSIPSNHGRLTVVAICRRNIAASSPADFVDVTTDLLVSGKPVRSDVLRQMQANAQYGSLRHEVFSGSYTNGQTVPLPVSPVDGYQYGRHELTYVYTYGSTAPNTNIRIGVWKCNVAQDTGLVTSMLTRVADGGGFVSTQDGSLSVWVMAQRDDIPNPATDYEFTGGAGGNGGEDKGVLLNGNMDNWRTPTDPTASGWSLVVNYGADNIIGRAPGLNADSVGFSQRLGTSHAFQRPIRSYVCVGSSHIDARPGDLLYYGLSVRGNGNYPGFSFRGNLFSAFGDFIAFTMFDGGNIIGTSIQRLNGWLEIPRLGDTTVLNSGGAFVLDRALDFVPVGIQIQLWWADDYSNPSVPIYWDVDDVVLQAQVDPSVGQIAQRGSQSLAFFPPIAFTVTDTTFKPTLNFTVNRVDGSYVTVNDGTPTTTGLTAATNYKWYPYLNELTQHIEQVLTGGVGTPPNLHTAATRDLYVEWYRLSHLPLAASPIDVTTTAAGAPPGGGYGGGDGGCLHSLMWVRSKELGCIQAHQVKVGMHLQGLWGTWLEVTGVDTAPHTNWCHVEFNHGGSLLTTDGHPFENIDGDLVRANELTLSTFLHWERGVCHPITIRQVKDQGIKVKISVQHPHVFLAGATKELLTATHNVQRANDTI